MPVPNPPDAVVLRDAAAADLPALLALESQFPGDRLSPRQFRHHLRNPRARLRVALQAGWACGYALLLCRAGSGSARLYSIVVDRSARGLGLGHTLLDDAEVQARRTGVSALRLEVRRDNTAALALYRACGYHVVAELPGYYEDGAGGWRLEKVLAGASP